MTDPTQDPHHGPAQDQPLSGDTDADWAAALSEQSGLTGKSTQAAGLGDESDDWASALAEQTAAQTQSGAGTATASASSLPSHTDEASPAAAQVFQPLANADIGSNSDIDMIMDIPVQLSVELGRARMTIKNILQLGQGSVVELEGLAGEPMDIFVNGYLIAQGEVVVVDEKYGIRVTDIITPSDRINRLNSRR